MESRAYMIGFILSRASLAMRRHVNRMLKKAGASEVSMGYIGALLSLYRADGRAIGELGDEVSLEKSTMTGLLDRMEKAGLVTREPDPADRRVLRIWLSPRGKNLMPVIDRVLTQSYQDLTSGLAEKDVEKMEKLLRRLIDNAVEFE